MGQSGCLIDPDKTTPIAGLTPKEFYLVLENPARLAGMPFPKMLAWEALQMAGFNAVVCLNYQNPPYICTPLHLAYAARLEDLAYGRNPGDPIAEENLIREAVRIVHEKLIIGEGVVVHCLGGTGRTGTVIACVLRVLGCSNSDISEYFMKVNKARKKNSGWPEHGGWPESRWQADLVKRFI